MRRLALALIAISSCGVYPSDTRAQEAPHVHGGYAACYAYDDWAAQQSALEARALERWNEIVRPLVRDGRCWLTEDGAIYNVRPSNAAGALLIQSPVLEKIARQDPPRWAYVAVEAVDR